MSMSKQEILALLPETEHETATELMNRALNHGWTKLSIISSKNPKIKPRASDIVGLHPVGSLQFLSEFLANKGEL